MTIKHNRMVGQGETFSYQAQAVNPAGEPVDLSEWSIELEVGKPDEGPALGVYEGTADDEGNVSVSVSAEDTAVWPVGRLTYLVTRTSDTETKWMTRGALTVVSRFES